jgi:hypothetical protein
LLECRGVNFRLLLSEFGCQSNRLSAVSIVLQALENRF